MGNFPLILLSNDIEMKHKVCGKPWNIVPNNFKKGQGCPTCGRARTGAAAKKRAGQKRVQWNNNLIQTWLNENRPGWKLVGVYENASTPVDFICDKGHDTTQAWASIRSYGTNCSTCYLQDKITKPYEFELQMCEAFDFQYVLVSDFVDMRTKVDLLHLKCGEIYTVLPYNFITSGNRCSCQSESRGQKAIREILQSKGFNFAEEVCFDKCRYKSTLPFDFVVYKEDNKTIDFIVEVDGEFHRQSIMGSDLEGVQLRDSIKDNYCKENEIPLLRIEYSNGDTSQFESLLEGFCNG